MVTSAPTSASSSSTLIVSPAATLYCLPPVLMTAYMFFLSHPLGAHTRLHCLRRVPGLFVGFRIDPDAAHSRTNELQRARQYTPSCGLNASSAFRPKAG